MNEIKGSKKLTVTLKKNKKDKMVDVITASPQVACMVDYVLSGDRIASVPLLFVSSIQCMCIFCIVKCLIYSNEAFFIS